MNSSFVLFLMTLTIRMKNCYKKLRGSLPKTGPLRFGSENQFPLNFAHEYILVQK